MAKNPYAYAPEGDEVDAGSVKLADECVVWHTCTTAEARELAGELLSAAEEAEYLQLEGVRY